MPERATSSNQRLSRFDAVAPQRDENGRDHKRIVVTSPKAKDKGNVMTRTVHAHDDITATIDRVTLSPLWREGRAQAPFHPTPFTRIVVGADGSESSRHALAWAALLARTDGAHLHVVSCVAPAPYSFDERISDRGTPAVGALASYQALVREEQADAQRLVDQIETRLTAEGLSVSTEVTLGFTARRLVEAAERQDAELVVLGSHEHGLLGHLFVSDTTDAVRSRAACHVLVAHGPPDIERVVIAVDGSEGSRHAARMGHALAHRLRKPTLFLHVFRRPLFADGRRARAFYEAARSAWAESEGAEADAAPPLAAKVRFGSPIREIVREAEDPPSLVVMGTSGHTGAKARLLGSASHAVVHAEPPAVLLVREASTTR